MSTQDNDTSPTTNSEPPHKALVKTLANAEVALLASLAASARDGDWEVVDQLFDTLPHLHNAMYHAGWETPGNPERSEGPPPPLDPPGGWPLGAEQFLSLAGIKSAVQLAEASALAEVASLAHDEQWPAVWAAYPVLQLLDFARREFQQ